MSISRAVGVRINVLSPCGPSARHVGCGAEAAAWVASAPVGPLAGPPRGNPDGGRVADRVLPKL